MPPMGCLRHVSGGGGRRGRGVSAWRPCWGHLRPARFLDRIENFLLFDEVRGGLRWLARALGSLHNYESAHGLLRDL